jgi:hypothetical protein
MRFVDLSVGWRPLKLYPLGNQRSPNTPTPHRDDPRKTYIHQQVRLLLVRQEPDELDSGLVSSFDDADLLWTGELFVAGNALDSVPK